MRLNQAHIDSDSWLKSITSGKIYKLLREKEEEVTMKGGTIIISTRYSTFSSLSFLDEHYGEQFYLIELWWGPKEFT